MTLERINNEGHYEPGNCRWATDAEQRLNKRTSRKLTFDGKTQTVTEWARELDMPAQRLWNRVAKKLPAAEVLGGSLKRQAQLVHGTTNGYNYHKCRCEECRAANRTYQNTRNQRRKA